MNSWHSFLHQQGASIVEQNAISFGEKPGDYPGLESKTTITPLIHLGLLSVKGADSARFLQGQVTCDVQQLSLGHSLIGARCNPKGRALADFLLCQPSEDQLLLVMNHRLVQQNIEELSKFAAFFKTQLLDASKDYQLIGICGEEAETLASNIPASYHYPLSDGRQLLIVPTEDAPSAWKELSASAAPTGNEFWHLQDIRAGLGHVQTETVAMFVPQMLNLQAIEGISFKKGCYTGQEVVARMKYLGKLKRRMYRLTTDSPLLPTPGTPCYLPTQKQSIGNIVQAANVDNNHQELLVVLTDEASKSDTLIIGEAPAQAVKQQLLPYDADE
jgi:tRNA-modifying protein YgfZ